MSVDFGMQHAQRVRRIILSPLAFWLYLILSQYLIIVTSF